MGTSNSSADLWPQDAAPRHWVAALFEKMTRMWGNTFLDKWRDVDLEGVMQEWGKGLRKLSSAELKAGVDSLITLKYPPNLPEFYGLCKQMRLHEMPRAEALTDQTRATPEIVEVNLARMREILSPLMQPKKATAQWAYELLMRGASESGRELPHEVVRCATDAISSAAGRAAIDECTDPDLRSTFAKIREGVLEGYRNANRRNWETA